MLRGDEQRLADREQADRERRHLDAVEQFRQAEGQHGLARQLVDADQAERKAEEQRDQAVQRRDSPNVAETVTKASTISAK